MGAVFRIAMSAIFSLILLFRLDEVALMKKFDAFDFGKCSPGQLHNVVLVYYVYILCMSTYMHNNCY